MREYTAAELDWEYEREFCVYAARTFPGVFRDRQHFQKCYDAALLVDLRGQRIDNWTGPLKSVDACRRMFGHRRDVERILAGFDADTLPPPIVLKHAAGLYLMSGNTRLSISATLGVEMRCRVIAVAHRHAVCI